MKRKDIERMEVLDGKTVITYKDGTVKRFVKTGGGSFPLEKQTPRHKQLPVRRSATGNIIQHRLRREDADTEAINAAIDEAAGIRSRKPMEGEEDKENET